MDEELNQKIKTALENGRDGKRLPSIGEIKQNEIKKFIMKDLYSISLFINKLRAAVNHNTYKDVEAMVINSLRKNKKIINKILEKLE